MFKQNYNVIGVMSGTSLDGVDLAHIHFNYDDKWNYVIQEAETVSYSVDWIDRLKKAVNFSKEELEQLDNDYTELLAQIITTFITKYAIGNIDAVCSHGHTILHMPTLGYTLQIGNLPVLSKLTNQNIVCDFRVQDVKLGGQGAPLVPIGDKLLFSEFDYCLNLGGFSNISFDDNGKRIAFDISPVNTVLNFYANKFNLSYDDKGQMAKSGTFHLELFNELNDIKFYKQDYPKSLGIEFVYEMIFPLIEAYKIPTKDKLNTFVEHIAFQISRIIKKENASLFISGGGVYNTFLIERIQFYLLNTEIVIPNDKVIQFKEALIFAFLGVLKMRNEINALASVTGASEDHSSGVIFLNNQ